MTLSIITPSLNRARFISEAVESVLQQDHHEVEHIIMDGGSTDGTLDVLDRYPHLRIFSHPDQGIYDALNKGIGQAHGDVIGFLNTDDLYEPGIFGGVCQTFKDNQDIDALVGGASIFHQESEDDWTTLAKFPPVPPAGLLARATIGAPIFNAWFFRRGLFEELGLFDLRYLYVADRDFLIRMAFRKKSYASLDRPFYRYRMHPGSYTLSGQDSGEAEYMFECRTLAENYLSLSYLNTEARQQFRTWHSHTAIEQIMTAVHRKAYHRALRYMIIGLRYDAGWTWLFAREVIRRASVLLRRYAQE